MVEMMRCRAGCCSPGPRSAGRGCRARRRRRASRRAVPGISCISPRAPTGLIAVRSNELSWRMMPCAARPIVRGRRAGSGPRGRRRGRRRSRPCCAPRAPPRRRDRAGRSAGRTRPATARSRSFSSALGQRADEQALVAAPADHAEIADRLGQRPPGEGGARRRRSAGGERRRRRRRPAEPLQREQAVKLVGARRRLLEPGIGLGRLAGRARRRARPSRSPWPGSAASARRGRRARTAAPRRRAG